MKNEEEYSSKINFVMHIAVDACRDVVGCTNNLNDMRAELIALFKNELDYQIGRIGRAEYRTVRECHYIFGDESI